ncbi:MAG: 30S ribosomal protein S4e [Nitrososphaeria archaeon]|nr:30S ribosomal protein S4e [Nitrososphaeria archaeon]
MGSMGSSRHMKRSAAPSFWKIPRKLGQFVVKPSPGPHPISESYSLAILLRDVLKVVKNMREARYVINSGKILVDGVVRMDKKFPVGLMDVIHIPSMNKFYRMLPSKKAMLFPKEIDSESAKLKLCKVKSKNKVKSNKFSYGLHDGRTILSKEDLGLNVGDSVLITIPEGKLVDKVKLEKGSLVLFLKGKHIGKIGTVNDLVKGTFSTEKSAEVYVEGETVRVPLRVLLVVGKDKPLLPVEVGE